MNTVLIEDRSEEMKSGTHFTPEENTGEKLFQHFNARVEWEEQQLEAPFSWHFRLFSLNYD